MTIRDHLNYLLPGLADETEPPCWPPDVFAIAASLLHVSGAYCVAANDWPPNLKPEAWAQDCERIGNTWRKRCNKPSGETYRCPSEIVKAWELIRKRSALQVAQIAKDTGLCHALLLCVAVADEASEGAGIPNFVAKKDRFDFKAGAFLIPKDNGSSLCDRLASCPFRVLPKMHTPQSGLTLRSFTHHLALAPGLEITPEWQAFDGLDKTKRDLNILLLPWPKKIDGKQFEEVTAGKKVLRNMPPKYDFFSFRQQNGADLHEEVIAVYDEAIKDGTHIDMLIMPELSISEEEYVLINKSLSVYQNRTLFIAGVMGKPDAQGHVSNIVRYNIPLLDRNQVDVLQSKHHRWKLEKNQIASYGLALDEKKEFWENIPVGDRHLTFVNLNPFFTLCVLICEDLARPDPVGDVIRAVGPNLVIALLLDGPQMKERWSARYAAALADDPGSSVLTLTSLGMTALSKPVTSPKTKRHTGEIALWKDGGGKAKVINVGTSDGIILKVEIEKREEFSADGRGDGETAGYAILKDICKVKRVPRRRTK